MNNAVKETLCTHCNHRDICIYKNDYLSILKAVSEAFVERACSDGKKVSMKKVTDFDFIGDISVTCRHYQNWTMAYRDAGNIKGESK